MAYPSNLYVYGVYLRVGVRWMGGSHMGKENNGTVVPIEIFIFKLSKYFTGSNKKLVLSLTP
jgi:hypothetical protein